MKLKSIAMLFLLGIQLNTHAQFPDGTLMVRGTGTISCGDYVTFEGNKAQLDLVNQWVWGFLVAYQMRGTFSKKYLQPTLGNITAPPDPSTINLFLKKFCNENPLSSVLNGTLKLVRESGGVISDPAR